MAVLCQVMANRQDLGSCPHIPAHLLHTCSMEEGSQLLAFSSHTGIRTPDGAIKASSLIRAGADSLSDTEHHKPGYVRSTVAHQHGASRTG